jgi:DNA-binding transcriptional MerR regulator
MSDSPPLKPDITTRTVQEVAARLDISPATLRRWADEFAEYLSPQSANGDNNGASRYSEQDIAKLSKAKQLMSEGLTYDEVRQKLELSLNADSETDPTAAEATPVARGLISRSDDDDLSVAALTYFSETVSDLRQGQMSVLNSQAANRELMGVVIQDNFSLKEENSRLRERMLELERQMSQLRRENEAKQEGLRQEFEAKLMEIREMASQSLRNPITVLQTRSGCLGGLFGSSRIEAVSQPADSDSPAPPPPSGGSQPRSHPKPPGPPE